MKLVTTAMPKLSAAGLSRIWDYLELTKPRISVMVLFTVAIAAVLTVGRLPSLLVLFHTLLGTGLVAAGASALNQWLERHSDALMRRTENRPLPGGRLFPLEALSFGLGMSLTGIIYLALTLERPWAAAVAAVTLLSYVFCYTPLKKVTIWNTLVGAVPGALPPVIGWAAVRESAGPGDGLALGLFLILFFWQVPHFMAIAWIHRRDYGQAGLRMVPVDDRGGRRTSRHMIVGSGLLLAASLLPAVLGLVGWVYVIGALILGLGFLARALRFRRSIDDAAARGVLRASLVYLPIVLTLLVVDRCWISVPLAFWR